MENKKLTILYSRVYKSIHRYLILNGRNGQAGATAQQILVAMETVRECENVSITLLFMTGKPVKVHQKEKKLVLVSEKFLFRTSKFRLFAVIYETSKVL